VDLAAGLAGFILFVVVFALSLAVTRRRSAMTGARFGLQVAVVVAWAAFVTVVVAVATGAVLVVTLLIGGAVFVGAMVLVGRSRERGASS
jgi:hypothetical protein